MIYINILQDFLNTLLANRDISNDRIERGEIEKEMKLDEFIHYLKMDNTIWVKDSENIIPFSIVSSTKADYLFYVSNSKELPDELISELEKIKYDLSQLTGKSNDEVALEKLYDKSHFIIDKTFYFNLHE